MVYDRFPVPYRKPCGDVDMDGRLWQDGVGQSSACTPPSVATIPYQNNGIAAIVKMV